MRLNHARLFMTTRSPSFARRVSWFKFAANRASATYCSRMTSATGGAGRRRESAASRSHCPEVLRISVALSRSAAYSAADTRTLIVALRRATGSPFGRPPADLRGVASAFIADLIRNLLFGEQSELAPQGKLFERSENMPCSEPADQRALLYAFDVQRVLLRKS
jgi:hypothetical protein